MHDPCSLPLRGDAATCTLPRLVLAACTGQAAGKRPALCAPLRSRAARAAPAARSPLGRRCTQITAAVPAVRFQGRVEAARCALPFGVKLHAAGSAERSPAGSKLQAGVRVALRSPEGSSGRLPWLGSALPHGVRPAQKTVPCRRHGRSSRGNRELHVQCGATKSLGVVRCRRWFQTLDPSPNTLPTRTPKPFATPETPGTLHSRPAVLAGLQAAVI